MPANSQKKSKKKYQKNYTIPACVKNLKQKKLEITVHWKGKRKRTEIGQFKCLYVANSNHANSLTKSVSQPLSVFLLEYTAFTFQNILPYVLCIKCNVTRRFLLFDPLMILFMCIPRDSLALCLSRFFIFLSTLNQHHFRSVLNR